MAEIILNDIAHSYQSNPANPTPLTTGDDDWALKKVDLKLEDGGAYALLGPSGCGKTTLLNIISGLMPPTRGRVLFGGEDVTASPPEKRHIAQIFQFPVIYDTMSVYDNLAFPLKNRHYDKAAIRKRVLEIAELTDLSDMLKRRAAGLTADEKQKISLARGLVRHDVNVIMLDEPLTSIDPRQKWKLRSKLKELHQKTNLTMIYVTHDQTEALTFADKVVVMNFGEVLQVGTPVELFDRPSHAFVGYFIGSPGMNFMDCKLDNGNIYIADHKIKTVGHKKTAPGDLGGGALSIGIRPEFVSLADKGGFPAKVKHVSDLGKNYIIDLEFSGKSLKMLSSEKTSGDEVNIAFNENYCYLYQDGYLVT